MGLQSSSIFFFGLVVGGVVVMFPDIPKKVKINDDVKDVETTGLGTTGGVTWSMVPLGTELFHLSSGRGCVDEVKGMGDNLHASIVGKLCSVASSSPLCLNCPL